MEVGRLSGIDISDMNISLCGYMECCGLGLVRALRRCGIGPDGECSCWKHMGLIFQSNLIISPLEPRCSFVDKFLLFDIIIIF